MKSKSNSFFKGGIIQNIVMLLFTITCIFPAIWLFYSGLKDKSEFYANPIALPKHPSWKYYIEVFQKSDILTWMLNSFRNTAISLVLIVCIGFVIGYFLARMRFRCRNLVYGYFMLGLLIPIYALMVPMYVVFTKLHINNQWYTLIFPYVAFGLPIAIFLVESYIKNLPIEIEEAASIDGCSFSRRLVSIVLPMCVPILVTVAIIQLFQIWNEFPFALILIDNKSLLTVPVGITLFKGQYVTEYPKMMAAMMISIFPTMVVYFIFSKQIIKGMVVGAVKG
jgi:raffinose/stachyose/melibiose transport system permease protein